MILAAAESPIASTDTEGGNSAERKPKIVWPASNEKKKWKLFEDEVFVKFKKLKGSTANKLKQMEELIYEEGEK